MSIKHKLLFSLSVCFIPSIFITFVTGYSSHYGSQCSQNKYFPTEYGNICYDLTCLSLECSDLSLALHVAVVLPIQTQSVS